MQNDRALWIDGTYAVGEAGFLVKVTDANGTSVRVHADPPSDGQTGMGSVRVVDVRDGRSLVRPLAFGCWPRPDEMEERGP